MPISTSSRPRSGPSRRLLAVSLPVMIAVSGFLGIIALSIIPLSPTAELVELSRQVKEARSGPLSDAQARAVDEAASNLRAARQAIEYQQGKSWQLRSYDRAQNLLWKAEQSLIDAAASPAPTSFERTEPAG